MSTEHNQRVMQRFDALLGADDLTELDDLGGVPLPSLVVPARVPQSISP